MRKLKNYFKLIVTAVICFFVSLVPGKNANEKMKKMLLIGQDCLGECGKLKNRNRLFSTFACDYASAAENVETVLNRNRYTSIKDNNHDYSDRRKNMFWMQGPGDRENIPKGVSLL